MRLTSICFFLITWCVAHGMAQDRVAQLAVARIQHIYLLTKQASENSVWGSFGSNRYNIPLIYYAGDTTYIANPSAKFLKQFKPKLIFETRGTKIFKMDSRLDTAPMHMEVGVSTGDTTAYDYYKPHMRCSSREEFEKVTGFKTDTRTWASMVLHECFHAFQFFHKEYIREGFKNNVMFPVVGERLQRLYSSFDWFKRYIDMENALILKAIQSTRKQETDSLIREFFKVRDQRRSQTKPVTDQDISFLEKSFETLEGTARFVEAYALEYPANDPRLKTVDANFDAVRTALFAMPESLFKTEISQRYYYATGYNITRLLKKLGHDYTTVLFQQPLVTLEDILKP